MIENSYVYHSHGFVTRSSCFGTTQAAGRPRRVIAVMRSAPPTLEALTETLRRAGIPVLVLRDRRLPEGAGCMELLVPPDRSRVAMRVFEEMSWRYELGNRGAWRLLPMTNYWWDPGLNLFLYWRLPAAPFPSRALRPLERALWARAVRGRDGCLLAEPPALLVHLAVQAARPGPRDHLEDWEDFVACRSRVTDWDRVWEVARHARVTGAVGRALAAAQAGAETPPEGPLFDGALGSLWDAAVAVQRRARPGRLARFLAAVPRLGDATIRCRITGTEVRAGPGVFVPTPDADVFVGLVLERVAGVRHPALVEVGSGCGAIALAVARARPDAEVHAVELSPAAVRWAKRNRRDLGLPNVRLYRGSLLQPVPADLRGKVSVLLANLPYYPSSHYAAIGGVPRDTIQGMDDDGLGLLRRLARDAVPFLRPGGRLLLQMFAWQWEQLGRELVRLGYRPGDPIVMGPFAIGPADVADE